MSRLAIARPCSPTGRAEPHNRCVEQIIGVSVRKRRGEPRRGPPGHAGLTTTTARPWQRSPIPAVPVSKVGSIALARCGKLLG